MRGPPFHGNPAIIGLRRGVARSPAGQGPVSAGAGQGLVFEGGHGSTLDTPLSAVPGPAAAAAVMELRFIFKSTSGKPRVHSKRLPIIVGRSDGDDVKLRIPKDAISRRHCEFLLDEAGQVCIRDLESTNGTFLEGRQLKPRVATPVASGASVRLGNVPFRVEYAAAAAEDATHDSETIPIEAEEEPPRAKPRPKKETPAPAVATDPPTATVGVPIDPPVAAEQPGDAAFAFLGEAASGESAAADEEGWPDVAEEAPAPDDKHLEDFFKGLP